MKTMIFSAAALVLTGTLLAGLQTAWSDSDEYDEFSENRNRWERMKMRSTGIAPAVTPEYQEECGGCHMAYPPGLLPSASWKKLMRGLDDHFGDNAELDEAAAQRLESFLVASAADRSNFRRSRAMMKRLHALNSQAPIRITDLPYFRHEHDEIPKRIIKQAEIGSLSQCNACHQYAEQGSFNEHEIFIQGIGRWDD